MTNTTPPITTTPPTEAPTIIPIFDELPELGFGVGPGGGGGGEG
jgi:hypothetical protein